MCPRLCSALPKKNQSRSPRNRLWCFVVPPRHKPAKNQGERSSNPNRREPDMDTMTAALEVPLLLASPTTETSPRVAAGRLPLMAFVDAETERVLQESAVMLGRCVIMRGGIGKATEYLNQQRSPQLLIVDISGVDMPLPQMQTLADVCEPGTDVVALGDRDSVGLYRDLIEAGISNYIVKPLTRDLLSKLLVPKTSAVKIAKTSLKLGKIVAFVGARGGVGTTTLAAN